MTETANYTPYTQRNRHAQIERTVAATIDLLGVAEIRAYLGVQAVSLAAILETVTIPTVKEGKVLFDRTQTDKLPIIPLVPGEQLYADVSALPMHDNQLRSMGRQYGYEASNLITDAYNTLSLRSSGQVELLKFTEHDTKNAVVCDYAASGKSHLGKVSIRSLPIMLLDASKPNATGLDIITHETCHVEQKYAQPVSRDSASYRRSMRMTGELQAYNVEAGIVAVCRQIGRDEGITGLEIHDDTFLHAEKVDAVRVRYQTSAEHPFLASWKVRRGLRRHGIVL